MSQKPDFKPHNIDLYYKEGSITPTEFELHKNVVLPNRRTLSRASVQYIIWLFYAHYGDITICECSMKDCPNYVSVPEGIKRYFYRDFNIEEYTDIVKFHNSNMIGLKRCEFSHIIPDHLGGEYSTDNIVIQCSLCNNKWGKKTLTKDKLKSPVRDVDMLIII